MPFFSIIIPTYNRPDKLKRSIKSVFQQSYNNFELIVVNDGSTIGTAVYKEIETELSVFQNASMIWKSNEGLANARNTGIENAKGKFVCFLDDDDEYLPNHLSSLYNLIQENKEEVGLYRTFTKFRNSTGDLKDQYQGSELSSYRHPLVYIYDAIITANNVCVSSEILKDYKFNPVVPIAEDYEMWTKILVSFPYFEIREITTIYDRSEETMSSGSLTTYYKYVKYLDIIFMNSEIKRILGKKIVDRLYKKYFGWIIDNLRKNEDLNEYKSLKKSIIDKLGIKYYWINYIKFFKK